jgi:hypothetical protein
MIAKYSSDGTLLWVKTWGYGGTDSAYSISNTSDGGFVIAGKESSAGYAYISKYDSAGTTEWTRTWGGGTIYNQASSAIQTSDGGYALAGQTRIAVSDVAARAIAAGSSSGRAAATSVTAMHNLLRAPSRCAMNFDCRSC